MKGNGFMNFRLYLEGRPKWCLAAGGALLTGVLGIIDYTTGPDVSFVVFYLIPVFTTAWFAGKNAGVLIALASGATWFWADLAASQDAGHPLVSSWNFVTKLGFFVAASYTVSLLRASLIRERDMARTDFLTQVANTRYFAELAARELSRSGRYGRPLTVAYLDIDNFKTVNDEWGHSTGDALLMLVAKTIRSDIRATDTVARLGGDEFALLLPETGYDAAEVVMQKVFGDLSAAMRLKGWPVTFSVGVVTYLNPPPTVDALIKAADGFMYTVKHAGKNMVKHRQIEYPAA